jgi:hypothetical protein
MIMGPHRLDQLIKRLGELAGIEYHWISFSLIRGIDLLHMHVSPEPLLIVQNLDKTEASAKLLDLSLGRCCIKNLPEQSMMSGHDERALRIESS